MIYITQVFMKSTRYSCQTVMNLEFSSQTFVKSSDIEVHENIINSSRAVTHRRNGRNTGFLQFCESASKEMQMFW